VTFYSKEIAPSFFGKNALEKYSCGAVTYSCISLYKFELQIFAAAVVVALVILLDRYLSTESHCCLIQLNKNFVARGRILLPVIKFICRRMELFRAEVLNSENIRRTLFTLLIKQNKTKK